MKANRPQLDKALKAPAETRFFLFHGPDQAGSRALAAAIGTQMGGEAERIDLAAAALKTDPARLADEAAALSMFGGARWILVEPADDGCAAAAQALLEAPAAGNPVALVAGALKPASALLKLALAAPNAIVFDLMSGRARGGALTQRWQSAGPACGPRRRGRGERGLQPCDHPSELIKFAIYVAPRGSPRRPITTCRRARRQRTKAISAGWSISPSAAIRKGWRAS